jgi:hypothetical protein
VSTNYADSPLQRKLGILDRDRVALLHAPKDFDAALLGDVTLQRGIRGRAKVTVAFFERAARLEVESEGLAQRLEKTGALWIAWPKKSSRLSSDITDHFARELFIPFGLVDNKVCAIDETWTALRFVWRVALR